MGDTPRWLYSGIPDKVALRTITVDVHTVALQTKQTKRYCTDTMQGITCNAASIGAAEKFYFKCVHACKEEAVNDDATMDTQSNETENSKAQEIAAKCQLNDAQKHRLPVANASMDAEAAAKEKASKAQTKLADAKEQIVAAHAAVEAAELKHKNVTELHRERAKSMLKEAGQKKVSAASETTQKKYEAAEKREAARAAHEQKVVSINMELAQKKEKFAVSKEDALAKAAELGTKLAQSASTASENQGKVNAQKFGSMAPVGMSVNPSTVDPEHERWLESAANRCAGYNKEVSPVLQDNGYYAFACLSNKHPKTNGDEHYSPGTHNSPFISFSH